MDINKENLNKIFKSKQALLGLFVIACIAFIVITVELVSNDKISFNTGDASVTTPALSFETTSSGANVGEEFDVNIKLDTGTEKVSATFVRVNYPNTLQALSITKADLLPIQLGAPNINQAEGKAEISLGADLNNPKSGSGTLATIKFKVLSDSYSQANLTFDINQTKIAVIGKEMNTVGSLGNRDIVLNSLQQWQNLVQEIKNTENLDEAITIGRNGGLIVEDINNDPYRLIDFKDGNSLESILTISVEPDVKECEKTNLISQIRNLGQNIINTAYAQTAVTGTPYTANICSIGTLNPINVINKKVMALAPKLTGVQVGCLVGDEDCERIEFAVKVGIKRLNIKLNELESLGVDVPTFIYKETVDPETLVYVLVKPDKNPKAYADMITYTDYSSGQREVNASMRVYMGTINLDNYTSEELINLMQHELLHSLGLANILDSRSIMYEFGKDKPAVMDDRTFNTLKYIYNNTSISATGLDCVKWNIFNRSTPDLSLSGGDDGSEGGGDDGSEGTGIDEGPTDIPEGTTWEETILSPTDPQFTEKCSYVVIGGRKIKTACTYCYITNGEEDLCFTDNFLD